LGENCSLYFFKIGAFCSLIGHFVPYVNQNYCIKFRIAYEIGDLLNDLVAGMVIAIKVQKAAGGSGKWLFGIYCVYPGDLLESSALLPTI
jgi:hypothetical protein